MVKKKFTKEDYGTYHKVGVITEGDLVEQHLEDRFHFLNIAGGLYYDGLTDKFLSPEDVEVFHDEYVKVKADGSIGRMASREGHLTKTTNNDYTIYSMVYPVSRSVYAARKDGVNTRLSDSLECKHTDIIVKDQKVVDIQSRAFRTGVEYDSLRHAIWQAYWEPGKKSDSVRLENRFCIDAANAAWDNQYAFRSVANLKSCGDLSQLGVGEAVLMHRPEITRRKAVRVPDQKERYTKTIGIQDEQMRDHYAMQFADAGVAKLLYKEVASTYGLPKEIDDAQLAWNMASFCMMYTGVVKRELGRVNENVSYAEQRGEHPDAEQLRFDALKQAAKDIARIDFKISADLARMDTPSAVQQYLESVTFGKKYDDPELQAMHLNIDVNKAIDKSDKVTVPVTGKEDTVASRAVFDGTAMEDDSVVKIPTVSYEQHTVDEKADPYQGKKVVSLFNGRAYAMAGNARTMQKLKLNSKDQVAYMLKAVADNPNNKAGTVVDGILKPITQGEQVGLVKTISNQLRSNQAVYWTKELYSDESYWPVFEDAARSFRGILSHREASVAASRDDVLAEQVGEVCSRVSRALQAQRGSIPAFMEHADVYKAVWGDRTEEIVKKIAETQEKLDAQNLRYPVYLTTRNNKPLYAGRTLSQIHEEQINIERKFMTSSDTEQFNDIYTWPEELIERCNRTIGDYTFHLATCRNELSETTNELGCCVGLESQSYWRKCRDQVGAIVLMDSVDGTRIACIELSNNAPHFTNVRQFLGYKNHPVCGKAACDAAKQWMDEAEVTPEPYGACIKFSPNGQEEKRDGKTLYGEARIYSDRDIKIQPDVMLAGIDYLCHHLVPVDDKQKEHATFWAPREDA